MKKLLLVSIILIVGAFIFTMCVKDEGPKETMITAHNAVENCCPDQMLYLYNCPDGMVFDKVNKNCTLPAFARSPAGNLYYQCAFCDECQPYNSDGRSASSIYSAASNTSFTFSGKGPVDVSYAIQGRSPILGRSTVNITCAGESHSDSSTLPSVWHGWWSCWAVGSASLIFAACPMGEAIVEY